MCHQRCCHLPHGLSEPLRSFIPFLRGSRGLKVARISKAGTCAPALRPGRRGNRFWWLRNGRCIHLLLCRLLPTLLAFCSVLFPDTVRFSPTWFLAADVSACHLWSLVERAGRLLILKNVHPGNNEKEGSEGTNVVLICRNIGQELFLKVGAEGTFLKSFVLRTD